MKIINIAVTLGLHESGTDDTYTSFRVDFEDLSARYMAIIDPLDSQSLADGLRILADEVEKNK